MKSKIIIITLFLLIINNKGFGMQQEYGVDYNRVFDPKTFKPLENEHLCNLILAWQKFLMDHTWQELIQDCKAITSGCGIVYELPNFLNNNDESFAIVDMRSISYTEPHYHPKGIEIYLVLQGTARVYVGSDEYKAKQNDIIIIPSQIAHFVIPDKNFVIAAINRPLWNPENYIPLTQSDDVASFDYEQFKNLTKK